MNVVCQIGRLVRDPEIKFTPSGMAVCKFSIAVDRAGDKDGEEIAAGFFDCEAWGKTAELINEYFHKGKQIGIRGRLKHHRWESREGDKRSKVEIVVEQMTFVGSKDDSDGSRQYEDSEGQQSFTPAGGGGGGDDTDQDIPFMPTV